MRVCACVANNRVYTRVSYPYAHTRECRIRGYMCGYIASWKQVDRLTFGRASFNPASDEYFRCSASPVSSRDATRRGEKEQKRKMSSGSSSSSSSSSSNSSSIGSSSIGSSSSSSSKRSSLVASMYRGAVPWRTFDPK